MQPGALFAIFLGWYSVSRFSTDFLRAYDRIKFGLTGAQWMSIGILIGALYVSWRVLQADATPAEATVDGEPEAVPTDPTAGEEVEV
jgi:prolipoprotein diacylglyceryltransferase